MLLHGAGAGAALSAGTGRVAWALPTDPVATRLNVSAAMVVTRFTPPAPLVSVNAGKPALSAFTGV